MPPVQIQSEAWLPLRQAPLAALDDPQRGRCPTPHLPWARTACSEAVDGSSKRGHHKWFLEVGEVIATEFVPVPSSR